MEAKFRSIRQLFNEPGAKFEVPPYQRGYEWGKKEFQDLWLDLQRLGDTTNQHYLGNIILLEKNSSELFEIVDGQQRMVTISLFLMAIRDQTIVGNKKDRRIDDIINSYRSADKERRLILNDDDAEQSFQNIWSGAVQEASGNIRKAYDYYSDEVDDLAEHEAEQLLKSIVNKLGVVRTLCSDNSLAYTIFQSQNERGKDVEPHVLAKSRIYGAADDLDNQRDIKKAKGQWDKIYRTLGSELSGTRWSNDNIKIRRPVSQILLQANVDLPFRIDKSDLYRNFEEVLTSFDNAVEFVDWFDDHMDDYLQITSGQYDVTARDLSNGAIRNLQYFNSGSNQAEVLSHTLYREIDDSDMLKEYLRLAATISMRFQLADVSSSEKGDAIYRVAASVREAEDNRAIRRILRKAAVEETPENGEIIENLKSNPMNYGGPYQFRTLLTLVGLEEDRRGALRVDLNNLHIDHVAPRRIPKDSSYSRWRKQIDEEEFSDVKNLLGNLTLLLPSDHNSIEEENFSAKQAVYNKSDLKIAQEVADYDGWTVENIRERTERLAKDAADKWSV